jgi:hypothetical protein
MVLVLGLDDEGKLAIEAVLIVPGGGRGGSGVVQR